MHGGESGGENSHGGLEGSGLTPWRRVTPRSIGRIGVLWGSQREGKGEG